MQNKKKLVFSVIIVLLICIVGFLFFKVIKKDSNNLSLSRSEKNWITSNKNQLIDIAILNKIPVINYSGNGIFFDFIEYVEKETGLEFNKIPYTQIGDATSPYMLTSSTEHSGELEIYQDNYVIASVKNIKYNDITEIDNLKIGVLTSDKSEIKKYLTGSDITFVEHERVSDFDEGLSVENKEVDAIVLPKLAYLNYILENNLTISYNMAEYKIYYYLALGNDETLNSILTKYYKKWYKDKYENSLYNHLIDSYFTFSDCDKNSLLSKRYTYGYINNDPYDKEVKGKNIGINNMLIKNFEKFANIEFIYKKYDNINDLVKDFNDKKVDIMFDNISDSLYTNETNHSVNIYDSTTVVLTHFENKNIFSSVKSFDGQNVLTVKNTKLSDYLNSEDYNLLTYDTIDKLINDLKKDDVIVIDKEVYMKHLDDFDQFKIDFEFKIDKYGFKINDNKAFNEIFDFYITYIPTAHIKADGYDSLYRTGNEFEISSELVVSILIIIVLLLFIVLLKHKPKTKKVKGTNLSKNDKLKYIDMLTSLKNRNYLNDNIEYWDSSEVYPQCIVIVDLNNIAYINDNYGHEAGDEVITEAANILINNQQSKTEIIRTSGNEFLIYMVEYDEKQVITYIKKLNREFKNLKYGFGAAIGYSMIVDGTKTVDDAVNEATADMRNIKEESNNHE